MMITNKVQRYYDLNLMQFQLSCKNKLLNNKYLLCSVQYDTCLYFIYIIFMKEDLQICEQPETTNQKPLPKYQSSKENFKNMLSLFFMVLITLLILSSITLSILNKKFQFHILQPQSPLKATLTNFIIYQCLCLMIVQWISQLLNYFGSFQRVQKAQKALDQGSITIIQYFAAFLLLVYIDWWKVQKNVYDLTSLMETFLFGGFIYYVALLLIEDVPYISLKMVGIGLQTFPIVWLAGDVASSKMT